MIIDEATTHNRHVGKGGLFSGHSCKSLYHSWLHSFDWAVFPDPIPSWELSNLIQDASGSV